MVDRTPTFLSRIIIGVDRWSWVILALCAPLLLFPSAQRSLVLLVIPALWLISFLAGSRPVLPTPLNTCLLVLSMMVLVSLFATYDIAVSLPKICGMVLGMAVFFAIVRWSRQPRGWWGSLVIFLLSGVGIATAGLLGTRWFTMKFDFLTPITDRLPIRITGLPGAAEGFHPNEVAGSLLWILPVFAILSMMILSGRGTFPGKSPRLMKWFINIVFLGLTGFIAAVFVLTQSRGGYIALALTLLILCILSLPKWSRLVLLIGGAVVAGSVGFWWMTSPSNPLFLQATQQTGLLTGPLSVGSFVARMEIWSRAIYGIQDFPFTGMGMNTFRRVVQLLYPLFSFAPDMDIGHAHNEFLQAGLDLGIPGLVGFIGINLVIFWMLIQTWRISHQRIIGPALVFIGSDTRKWLCLGLLGGFLAHFFYGITDAVSLGAKPGILFWMLLGLVTGLYTSVQSLPEGLSNLDRVDSPLLSTRKGESY